ncbi:MAG TPA: hypothetical protein VGP33_16770 [Chloroflexota bacterium]|nr:hypothetical protein [Chloroflexota bacterium]
MIDHAGLAFGTALTAPILAGGTLLAVGYGALQQKSVRGTGRWTMADPADRRTPVAAAIAVNAPLWAYPRTGVSAATLREWGCRVLAPVARCYQIATTAVFGSARTVRLHR